jgi:SPP1 gp7 family putative phage head morphogenesis protein
MAKPATYWQKRFEIYEARSNLKSQSHIKSLEKEYRAAKKAVEKDLKVFYNRLAANNDLPDSVAAKKLLDKNELADFKMDLKTYTQMAKENGITGDYTKMLENASLKHRISRLEAMKLQLEQKATMLMHSEKTGLEKFAKSAYENAYYNGGFEIAKGTGVGKSLFQLDDKKINTVIHKPWAADGKNFSTRVWGQHRPQLVNNLHRSLTDALTRGTGPDKAIAAISHDFDVSLSAAARIVQTEEAYFSSVAQRDVFAELDVEQYQIIATLDGHTSEICRDLDNKVFKMEEYEAGVTAPPFHPRCRTTTAPYFDDEVDATRAARDPETGQTVQVPADMNYQQWKDNYTVDPETGKTPAQMKAEQKAAEEAAKAKAEAEAKKKAQEEAAAAAKAKAEAEAKAQAEAAQKAKEAEAKAKAEAEKKAAEKAAKEEAKNKKIIDDLDQKEYKGLFKGVPHYADIPADNYPDVITPGEYYDHANAVKAAEKFHKYQEKMGFGDPVWHEEQLAALKALKTQGKAYSKAMDALGGNYKSPTTLAKEAAEEAAKKAAEEAAAQAAAKKAAAIEKMKATKAAKAAKLKEAQAQLTQIQDNEFKGIWKDPVTPADYAAKKDAIAAKHAYFDAQIAAGKDVEKFTKLKADLDEFEFQGAKYQALQAEIDSLKPKPRKKKIDLNDPDAYSQARKDAAYWFKGADARKRADAVLREKTGEIWRGSSDIEKKSLYDYTAGSGKFNRPLSGYQGSWSEYNYKGIGKVPLNYEGGEEGIQHLTKMLDRSTYPFDIWVQRGEGVEAMESFLGLTKGSLSRMSQQELQKFVGQKNIIDRFLSTTPAKGDGFSGDVVLNIYCPKGTKMIYAEPVSAYGRGAGLNWDGKSKQSSFGGEFETLLQRGGTYEIKKIEKSGGRIYIDLDIHPEAGYSYFGQKIPM